MLLIQVMNLRSLGLAAVALALLGLAPQASGQVLVYKLDIDKTTGINFHTFEGGYFAAPILGGTGSFLLTATEGVTISASTSSSTSGSSIVTSTTSGTTTTTLTGTSGRTYTESDGSGTLFTAVGGGEKKAVISATTGTGTGQGALVALGDIGHTVHVDNAVTNLSVRVAKSLSGTGVSADSESTATSVADDGSIGSAGISHIKFALDESQTNSANRQGLSLSQTMDQLKLDLERRGFSNSSSSTTTGTTTTATSTTSGS